MRPGRTSGINACWRPHGHRRKPEPVGVAYRNWPCTLTHARALVSAGATRRGGWQGEMLGHGDFDDARAVYRQRLHHGIGNLVWAGDVKPACSIHLCQLVEAWIDEIHTDIAPVIETLLLGLFGAVAAVVEHNTDQGDAPAHGSVEFLRGIQEPTVALQAHGGTIRSPQLSAEAHTEPHAEPAMTSVVEHRPRHLKVQAIVTQARRDAGINGHHTVTWQGLAQLRIDPLWHHGVPGQCQFSLQPRLAARGQCLYLGTPLRAWLTLWMHLAQGLEYLLRHRFRVSHDTHRHRIVAHDLLHVDVHLYNARLRVDDTVVPGCRSLIETRPQRQDNVGAVDGLYDFASPSPARWANIEAMAVGHRVVMPVRRHQCHIAALSERYRVSAGFGVNNPATGQQQRPLRLRQERRGTLDGLRVTGNAPIHSTVGFWR